MQQKRSSTLRRRPPPTTSLIASILLLLLSSSVIGLIDAASDEGPDVSISNINIDCMLGSDGSGGGAVSQDDLCAMGGDVMTCRADMTCTTAGTTTTTTTTVFEGDIICGIDALNETTLIDGSQQEFCQCSGILIDGNAPPNNALCDCYFCDPATSTVPVSYECSAPIINGCLGIDCSGNCIEAPPSGGVSDNNNGTSTGSSPGNNNTSTNPEQGMMTEYVVTDLSMAGTGGDNGDDDEPPHILFEVLPTNDERHFLIHVPDQSEVYMISFESSVEESVNRSPPPPTPTSGGRHRRSRSLQTTTCPPQDGIAVLTSFNEETNTTIVELDLNGQDTEIVICSSDNEVLANYFVAYENGDMTAVEEGNGGDGNSSTPISGGGDNNVMEPDYTSTYDFINMDDNNGTASYEVLYGPGAPDGQNGTGWIVLAGDLAWYESTTNTKIGDPCPVGNVTFIEADPNFPFTLYEHDGMDPPNPEVLHGCDPTQTTVVGEVLFVYVEPPTMAPVQAPILPPTSFKQDCENFNISLRENLEPSCENWCSPGESEVFDFAAPKSEGSNQIDRNSVCRCCNDEGPCQNPTTLQSKWECWSIEENVLDLSNEIKPCSEMDIASQTQCEDYCFANIDGKAWEFDGDGDVDGNPVCKCGSANYTVCGVEPDDDDGGLSTGALIGIIIGALLLLCCCLLLLFLLCCRKKDDEEKEEEEDDEDIDDRYVDPEEGYDDDDDDEEPKLALGYDDEESDDEEESDEEESDDDEPRLALTNGSDDDDEDESEEESDSEEGSDSEFEDEDSR